MQFFLGRQCFRHKTEWTFVNAFHIGKNISRGLATSFRAI